MKKVNFILITILITLTSCISTSEICKPGTLIDYNYFNNELENSIREGFFSNDTVKVKLPF